MDQEAFGGLVATLSSGVSGAAAAACGSGSAVASAGAAGLGGGGSSTGGAATSGADVAGGLAGGAATTAVGSADGLAMSSAGAVLLLGPTALIDRGFHANERSRGELAAAPASGTSGNGLRHHLAVSSITSSPSSSTEHPAAVTMRDGQLVAVCGPPDTFQGRPLSHFGRQDDSTATLSTMS